MNNLGRRHMAVLLTGLFLLGAMRTDAAQDVVKVSPETHTVLLESDRVRVLDVRIKPSERVAMHSHPPSVIHYLSDGSLKVTSADGRAEACDVNQRAEGLERTLRPTLQKTWVPESSMNCRLN